MGSEHKVSRCNDPKDNLVSTRINTEDTKLVSSTKYFRVQIDQILTWDDQIKAIKVKASRAIGLLKYAKKFLTNDTVCKTYTGLVEP